MTKKTRIPLFVLTILLSLGSACTRSSAPEAVVHLAIWSQYLTPEQIQTFEKNSGVRIVVSNYSSNEELLAKIQAGASGYDVVVPSDYMVFVMSKLGLLTPIDSALLTNTKDIEPSLLGLSYDPKNQYSVPYAWGTTGIAYRTDKVATPPKSWREFFSSPGISLLDDAREALGAALKANGSPLNTTDSAQLAQAQATLKAARAQIKAFSSEPKLPLIQGEASLAQAYSTDALQARAETKGVVQFVLPTEGGTLWVDNLVIPKGAKNVAQAHQLIDFLISEASGIDLAKRLWVAPASKKAKAALSPELRKDRLLFPDQATLKRYEMIQDLGPALGAWDRIWTEIKAER